MEKFIYLMKMTFMTKLAYVKAFWINIAGTFASIVIYYFLWQFVFRQQDSLAGYTAAEMTAYVILSRMLSSQFSGGINYELSNWIRTGMIGTELLRPVSLFFTLFAKRAGEFVFFALFKGAPIALVSFLILGGTAPAGVWNFMMFLASIGLSVGIMFFFEFMVGLCAFYTNHSYSLAYAKSSLLSILSGGVVPLFLFPEGLAKALDHLPFAGMVSVPVNIYLGKYLPDETWRFVGLQIVWILTLWAAAHIFYSQAIRRIVVQGG
ncbi:MAG: hypothetical protein HFG92_09020 [Dorea sp.]|jgi:ABC-2 type transport system permease protein|nr:hypothetical protein [Dorea sp.]